jgi:DNA polymerase-4
MSAIICHLDMDAYFAAVEERHNPQLRGRPVIVGGAPNGRGVVSTCSYEARKFGIHSAMPSAEAYRKCPHGVFVRGSFSAYTYIAEQLRELLQQFSPVVKPASIDEVVFDLSDVCADFREAEQYAKRIKAEIYKQLSLTASLGIAANRLVAKIASAMEKPDGLTCIPPEAVVARLSPLPVGCVWGVGPVMQQELQRFGIDTVGDLFASASGRVISSLQRLLSVLAERLTEVQDCLPTGVGEHLEKSMSHSETLARDAYDPDLVKALLLLLTDKVVMRLVRKAARARTVGLRLRYPDWQTITRDKTLSRPVHDFATIYQTVCTLLPRGQISSRGIRLAGVRLSNLHLGAPVVQSDLFETKDHQRAEALRQAIRTVRDKYGDQALKRAASLIAPH